MHKVSENIDQILKYKQKMSFLAQICLINPDFGALKNIFKNLASSLFSNHGNVSPYKKSRKST